MISAILLAAGKSRRTGSKNKLIEKINNKPLLVHSVNNILESSVQELIIVLGHQKEIIEKLIIKNEKIKFVFNKNFANGISSSIKIGLSNLSEKTEAFFICLGDMPHVNKNIYNQLIEKKSKKEIIVPTYKKQQGNPILFSLSMKKKIMEIEGDVGAKKIIMAEKNKVLNFETNDEGVTKDYNTLNSFNN